MIIVSHPTETDQAVLRPFISIDLSNETHFIWILYPPWKCYNDFFNDKPNNHSGISCITYSLID